MNLDELFDALDLDSDGELSRTELHTAARRLEWYWREAPLYAVLDLMTVRRPLPRDAFMFHMTQIMQDPHGPFGEVLKSFSYVPPSGGSASSPTSPPEPAVSKAADPTGPELRSGSDAFGAVRSLLQRLVGPEIADDYDSLVRDLGRGPAHVSVDDSALLVIDPQRSFTRGTWMHSVGAGREFEVEPLQMAFDNCARLLGRRGCRVERIFTRCPFPPDSYDWEEGVSRFIDASHLYFLKPGNSVLWPPTNGFREWVGDLIDRGKKTLVMGGCTLNSCVRVSAIETQQFFANQGLQVVVDLSLSGARASNYLRSDLHGGMSPVESAVRQLAAAKVGLMPQVEWR